MNKKFLVYAAVVIVAVVWGLSMVGSKIALESATPIQVLAVRWLIGALVLGFFAVTRIIKVSYKGKPLKDIAVLAALQPCAYSIFEMTGIDMTTASESSIIIATVPLVVALVSSFIYHRKIKNIAKLGIVLAFVGVLCTTVFSPYFTVGGKALGYANLVCAVIAGALYTIKTNAASKYYTPMEITLVMGVSGAVFFNLIMLVKGYGFGAYTELAVNHRYLMAILFLGLGCTALCYVCYNLVMAELPPHIASTVQINLTTLVGIIGGIVIGGDPYGVYTFIGVCLMLTGLAIAGLSNRGEEPEATEPA